VSLAVRNEFDHIYNDSVEKALDNYVGVERLTGDNQYLCDKCQSKQDAHKGLKFKSFPPILMLQLKRFDLDYETMQRVKINDKVTFPQVLNLNPYVNLAKSMECGTAKMEVEERIDESSELMDMDLRPLNLEDRDLRYSSTTAYEAVERDMECYPVEMDYTAKKAHMDKKAAESRIKRLSDIERFKREGENVFELFSILIHSGSALGGHYYSYIKSFTYDRWFVFNDSTVYEIDETELEKAFGGETTKLWGNYTTSACAYLLVYRKV
jgi:ubiquitin carboxyl-terminal hydrolase 47